MISQNTKRPLSLLLAAIMLMTLLPAAALAEEPVTAPVTIVSYALAEDIEVAQGTVWEALELPDTLAVTLADETTAELTVTWSSAPEYDGNTPADYILTAAFGEGYALAEGVAAPTMTVTVAEAVLTAPAPAPAAPAPVLINAYTAPENTEAAFGTAWDALELPGTLAVTLADAGEAELAVTWSSAEYDGNAPADYILTAVFGESYTLAEGVAAPTMTVTVEAENTDPVSIVTVTESAPTLLGAADYLTMTCAAEAPVDTGVEFTVQFYIKAEQSQLDDPKLVISYPGAVGITSYYGTNSTIGSNMDGEPVLAESATNAGTSTLTYNYKYAGGGASTMEITFPVRFKAYGGLATGERFTITAELYNGDSKVDTETVTKSVNNTFQNSPSLNYFYGWTLRNNTYLQSKDEISYLSFTPSLSSSYCRIRSYRTEDIFPFTDLRLVMTMPNCLTPGTGTGEATYVPMVSGTAVSSGNFTYTYYESYTIADTTCKAIVYTCPNKTFRDVATALDGYISLTLPKILFKCQLTDADASPSISSFSYYPPARAGTFTMKDGSATRTLSADTRVSIYLQMDDISTKYRIAPTYCYPVDLFAETESSFAVSVANSSGYAMKDAVIDFTFSKQSEADPDLDYYEAQFSTGGFDLGKVTAIYTTNKNSSTQRQTITAAADTLSFGEREHLTSLSVEFERLPTGLNNTTLVTLKLRRQAEPEYSAGNWHEVKATLRKPSFDGYTGDNTNVTDKSTDAQTFYTQDTLPASIYLGSHSFTNVQIGDEIYVEVYSYGERLETPEYYLVMPNEYRFSKLGNAESGYTFSTSVWDEGHTLYSLVYANGGKPYDYLYFYFTVGPTVNINISPQTLPTAFYYNNLSSRYPIVDDERSELISAEEQTKFPSAAEGRYDGLWKYTYENKTSVSFENIGSFNTTGSVSVDGGAEDASVGMRLMDKGRYRLYFANHLSFVTTVTNFEAVITIPKDGGTCQSGSDTLSNTLSLALTGAASGSGIFSEAAFTYSTDGGQSFTAAPAELSTVTHVKAAVASADIRSGHSGYIDLPLRPLYDEGTLSSDAAYVSAHLKYTRMDDGDSSRVSNVDMNMEPAVVTPADTEFAGTVYYDDDADGMKDTSETTEPNGVVYLDKKEEGEWRKIICTDDDWPWNVYSYTLGVLLPGEYRLRYMLPWAGTDGFNSGGSLFTDTSADTDDIPGNEIATNSIILNSNTDLASLTGYSLGLQRKRTLSTSVSAINLVDTQSESANFTFTFTPALQGGETVSLVPEDSNFSAVLVGSNTVRVTYNGSEVSAPASTKLTVSAPNTAAFGGAESPVAQDITVNILPLGCDCSASTNNFVLSTSYYGDISDVGESPEVVIPYNNSDKSLYYKLSLALDDANYCTIHNGSPQVKIEIVQGSDIAALYYPYAGYITETASAHTGNVTLGDSSLCRVPFTGSGTVKLRATFTNPHNTTAPVTTVERTITVIRQNKIDFTVTPQDDLVYDKNPKPVTVTATNYNNGGATFTDTTAYSVSYKKGSQAISDVPTDPGTYTAVINMTNTATNAPYVKGTVGGTSTFTILPNTSTLTVDPNGGTWNGFTAAQNYTQSSETTKAIPVPTRSGYTFAGWTKSADFKGAITTLTAAATYTFGITGGVSDTLTASWTLDKHSVSYAASQHGRITGSATADYETAYTDTLVPAIGYSLPASITMTMDGSDFTHFNYSSATGKISIAKNKLTGDIVISGVCTPSSYTVEYAGNGSIVGSTTANYETAYTDTLVPDTGYSLPAAITMTMGGAPFTDFSYSGTTGEISIAKNKLTGNVVITGACTPNSYTVRYNGSGATGGGTAESAHVYDVAKALSPNGFTRIYNIAYDHNYSGSANTGAAAAYTFTGWSTAAGGGGTGYVNGQSVTNLATAGVFDLYAKWAPASVTLPTLTRADYSFGGWYRDPACTEANRVGDGGASYTPTTDITLYAKWTLIPFTVVDHESIEETPAPQETGTPGTPTAPAAPKVYDYGEGKITVIVPPDEDVVLAQLPDKQTVIESSLTPDEFETVANGSTIDIKLDVKRVKDEQPTEEKQAIESAVEDFSQEVEGLTMGLHLDISLAKRIDGGDWQPIPDSGKPLTVVIQLPEEMIIPGVEYYIIRNHEGGCTLLRDQDHDPATITILTQYFSAYAIAYKPADAPNIWLWIALAAAALLLPTGYFIRKKRLSGKTNISK